MSTASGSANTGHGTAIDRRTREQLADAFEAVCPSPGALDLPSGYRDSGFALVDAIFSMQAQYDGVRRVVANYASHVGIETEGLPTDMRKDDRHGVVDLRSHLEGMDEDQIADEVFDNRSKSASVNRLKAGLVVEAADRLTGAGVRSRHDMAMSPLENEYVDQKKVWTAIRGLGAVTFEYFRSLCGAETSKPDIMVLRWLGGVLGRSTDAREALLLIAALTEELDERWNSEVSQRAVDHTIWRHQSGRAGG